MVWVITYLGTCSELRRLPVVTKTCPGVWVDDDPDIQDVVIIGDDLDPSPVPLGTGERAVRIRRRIVQSANL